MTGIIQTGRPVRGSSKEYAYLTESIYKWNNLYVLSQSLGFTEKEAAEFLKERFEISKYH